MTLQIKLPPEACVAISQRRLYIEIANESAIALAAELRRAAEEIENVRAVADTEPPTA